MLNNKQNEIIVFKKKKNIQKYVKYPNDGYLGSCIDDERSKSRKVV